MWKRYIAPVMLVSGSATVFRRPEDKVTHKSGPHIKLSVPLSQGASQRVEPNWPTDGRRYVCADARIFPKEFSLCLCLRPTIDLFDFCYALTMQYQSKVLLLNITT